MNPGKISRELINQRIAVWLTQRVGSMNAAYIFMALAVVSLPAAIMSGSLLIIVGWTAQTFLQLVLLPVIMVGQSVAGDRVETVIQETHALAIEQHEETHKLLDDLNAVLMDVQDIMNDVHSMMKHESNET